MFVSVYKRLTYGSSLSFSYLGVIKGQADKRIETLLNGRFGRLFATKPLNFNKMNTALLYEPQKFRRIKIHKRG
jgi:hypothetical protein